MDDDPGEVVERMVQNQEAGVRGGDLEARFPLKDEAKPFEVIENNEIHHKSLNFGSRL